MPEFTPPDMPAGSIALPFGDGLKAVVPDSINLMTPYVLREQGDWFEDEIRFVRKVLEPGANVVDIGANYGMYTLSMAKAVGPSGRVDAFEPASATAAHLRRSLYENGFGHVRLHQMALSNHVGTTRFALETDAELNRVLEAGEEAGKSEEVNLTTLDIFSEQTGIRDVSFLKLDAEGEEERILEAAKAFFERESPLVMFEIVHVGEVHSELVDRFEEMSYSCFRLVPGFDLLIPISSAERSKEFMLNVFCCKADRARKLESAGWLTRSWPVPFEVKPGAWVDFLAGMGYTEELEGRWAGRVEKAGSAETKSLLDALDCYAFSADEGNGRAARAAAAYRAFRTLRELCDKSPNEARLSSLARVAWEVGEREPAIKAMQQLIHRLLHMGHVKIREPFLLPSPRFESIEPSDPLNEWLLGAVVEQVEKLRVLSSYFDPQHSAGLVDHLHKSGYLSAEMANRRELIHRRLEWMAVQ